MLRMQIEDRNVEYYTIIFTYWNDDTVNATRFN